MTPQARSRRGYLSAVASTAAALAGCLGAPSQQTDDSETPIPVEGGELGVDQDEVFRQVNELLGTDVDPPERVRVQEQPSTGEPPSLDTAIFGQLITDEISIVTGYSGTYSDGEVTMATAGQAETDIEATLAHEYVHHVQHELGLGEYNPEPYEGSIVLQSLDEGGAVFVTDAYVDEYMDWQQLKEGQVSRVRADYGDSVSIDESAITSQLEFIEAAYLGVNAAERLFAAPYYFGSQYLAGRLDSVQAYLGAYDDPPGTMEQVIHRYPPGSEQPVPLEVDDSALSELQPNSWGRLGELMLRLWLFSELDEQTAVRAAEGWGNDELIQVSVQDSPASFESAWTIRMDTATAYAAFRDAVEEYLDSRAVEQGEYWLDDQESLALTVEDVDERTLVLGVGSEAFVQSLAASTDGDAIRLESSL